MRMKQTVGFMFPLAIYAPTKMCRTKGISYSKLDSVLNQCPSRDKLIVFNFSAVTSTEKVSCEQCVGLPPSPLLYFTFYMFIHLFTF